MEYDGKIPRAEAERLARICQKEPPPPPEQPTLFDEGYQTARQHFKQMFGEY